MEVIVIKNKRQAFKSNVQMLFCRWNGLNKFLNFYEWLSNYTDYRQYLNGTKFNNYLVSFLLISVWLIPGFGRQALMFLWIIGLLIYLFRIQWVEFKGRSLLSGSKNLAKELRKKGINIRGWRLVDRVDQNGGLAFEVVLIQPHSILYNLTFKLRKKYLVSKKSQVEKERFAQSISNAFISRKELRSWDRYEPDLEEVVRAISMIKERDSASAFYISSNEISRLDKKFERVRLLKTNKLLPLVPGRLDFMGYHHCLKSLLRLKRNQWEIYKISL
ncbi:hypothetical protein [Lactiplantibacillus plantarum]|uniref:hypothetical protein n=1 Tax=Lactiplantibacillus plantarum TaxID=1590 RepID=UPI00207468A5|nr:hypothetical protein [Lactiplantibacillus plantarum]